MPSCISIGIFDGVHLAHQQLLCKAAHFSHQNDEPLYVITFDKDPDEIFHRNFKKLIPNKLRIDALKKFSGVDEVVLLPANKQTFSLEPDTFLNILKTEYDVSDIFVGENFCFGKGAKAGIKDMQAWAAKNNCTIHVSSLFKKEGKIVSSSSIRQFLELGKFENALDFLHLEGLDDVSTKSIYSHIKEAYFK